MGVTHFHREEQTTVTWFDRRKPTLETVSDVAKGRARPVKSI